ncbi:MAG: polysaccharide pyruvyl transferase CsaB [bacterium]|nr:polysaccharide pyruvyl transferase CsaB [bacterium]
MKFLLAGYFGFGNFGDEAILKYAVAMLRYYYKEAQISIITQNPDLTAKEYGLNGIYRFDFKKIIFSIKNCDCLIFPGGSILQDITSIKSIMYYLSLIWFGIIFKKKVIMISQGIGPIKNSLAQKLTQKLLKKVSFIAVRDEKSFELLRKNDIPCELTADLIWAFTQKTNAKEDEQITIYGDIPGVVEKSKVGIQLRNWADLTEEKLQIIAKNTLKFFPKLDFDYKLICLQKNSDEKLLIRLGEIMHEMQPKARIELCIPKNTDNTVELLQNMDYMIAMRFHAGLCTINAEKPLLMLSYDPKTEEFCRELGLEYVNIQDLTENSYTEKIKWLKEFNPAKTALKTNILVKKSQQNVDLLIREIDK